MCRDEEKERETHIESLDMVVVVVASVVVLDAVGCHCRFRKKVNYYPTTTTITTTYVHEYVRTHFKPTMNFMTA